MKFRKEWFFGGAVKEDENDWVEKYVAENGMEIEVCYAWCSNERVGYKVGDRSFTYLKSAKAYCEAGR